MARILKIGSVTIAGLMPQVRHAPFADEVYCCPTRHWLERTFFPWYRTRLNVHKVHLYAPNNDCDNFATYFRAFALMCHAQQFNVPDGLAVGWYYYFVAYSLTQGHAINPVVLAVDGEPQLTWVEPDGPKIITLTQADTSATDGAWFYGF